MLYSSTWLLSVNGKQRPLCSPPTEWSQQVQTTLVCLVFLVLVIGFIGQSRLSDLEDECILDWQTLCDLSAIERICSDHYCHWSYPILIYSISFLLSCHRSEVYSTLSLVVITTLILIFQNSLEEALVQFLSYNTPCMPTLSNCTTGIMNPNPQSNEHDKRKGLCNPKPRLPSIHCLGFISLNKPWIFDYLHHPFSFSCCMCSFSSLVRV